MTNWNRSTDQVRREFNVPDIESNRFSALADVLARIPHEDYQRLAKIKGNFTWFIPHAGIGGVVKKQQSRVLYLSPELENAAVDIVGAYAAHKLAHILLGHDCEGVSPDLISNNSADEIAAWKLALNWGYETEIKKLKGTMKRRKTRAGDMVGEWIGTALSDTNKPVINEIGDTQVEKPSMQQVDKTQEKHPDKQLRSTDKKRLQKSGAKKPLALIVEDDKDSARLYSRILVPMGYDYQIVPDQESAITRLGEIEPQMVLLDMSLTKWKRDTAGAVILNKIRQDERLKNTRVIVVTAYSVLADEVVNDVEGILIKPISAVKLKDLILAAE